jgi:endonuclease/exonuclease/phosphatase family metal-dependent hydrolase
MPKTIRVATANIAGAARAERADPCKFELLASVLSGVDAIGLQEVVRVIDPATGRIIQDDLAVLTATHALSGYHSFFFPHLDSTQHPHPKKWSSDVFKQYWAAGYRIHQGTAILVAPQHAFWHLLEDDRPGDGSAQILPWYDKNPTFYRGDRDTEPRSLLVTRVRIGRHFILFCCTQLATLSKEDTEEGRKPTRGGRKRRKRQIEWIVDYLQDYQNARKEYQEQRENAPEKVREDPVILVGDFNTAFDAEELDPLKQFGLAPVRCGGHSHRKHRILMDLVFAPKGTRARAKIIDLSGFEALPNRRISDHHPVIADIHI